MPCHARVPVSSPFCWFSRGWSHIITHFHGFTGGHTGLRKRATNLAKNGASAAKRPREDLRDSCSTTPTPTAHLADRSAVSSSRSKQDCRQEVIDLERATLYFAERVSSQVFTLP